MDIEQYKRENPEQVLFLTDEQIGQLVSAPEKLNPVPVAPIVEEYKIIKGKVLKEGDLVRIKATGETSKIKDIVYDYGDEKVFILQRFKRRTFYRAELEAMEPIKSEPKIIVPIVSDQQEYKILKRRVAKVGDWVRVRDIIKDWYKPYRNKIYQIRLIDGMLYYLGRIQNVYFLRKDFDVIEYTKPVKQKSVKDKEAQDVYKVLKNDTLKVGDTVRVKAPSVFAGTLGKITRIILNEYRQSFYYLEGSDVSFSKKELEIIEPKTDKKKPIKKPTAKIKQAPDGQRYKVLKNKKAVVGDWIIIKNQKSSFYNLIFKIYEINGNYYCGSSNDNSGDWIGARREFSAIELIYEVAPPVSGYSFEG